MKKKPKTRRPVCVYIYTIYTRKGDGKTQLAENRMYISEQIQFEWISSKLEMGNPRVTWPGGGWLLISSPLSRLLTSSLFHRYTFLFHFHFGAPFFSFFLPPFALPFVGMRCALFLSLFLLLIFSHLHLSAQRRSKRVFSEGNSARQHTEGNILLWVVSCYIQGGASALFVRASTELSLSLSLSTFLL